MNINALGRHGTTRPGQGGELLLMAEYAMSISCSEIESTQVRLYWNDF